VARKKHYGRVDWKKAAELVLMLEQESCGTWVWQVQYYYMSGKTRESYQFRKGLFLNKIRTIRDKVHYFGRSEATRKGKMVAREFFSNHEINVRVVSCSNL
jgi:hypothetical protein